MYAGGICLRSAVWASSLGGPTLVCDEVLRINAATESQTFRSFADLLCYHENSGLSETKTKHLGSGSTFPQEEKVVGQRILSPERPARFGARLSLLGL